MNRWSLALVVLAAAIAVICSPAWAEGGASIASAPAVTYGQQEFGDLAYGGINHEQCGVAAYRSWWTLPVTVGDSVQVDWEAKSSEVMVNLFAPGITDFNFPTNTPLVKGALNNNLKAELTYQATVSGSLPLEFSANFYECGTAAAPGPYSFTADVIHTVRLAISRRSSLPLHGTLPVFVHDPAGGPITDPNLQVQLEIRVHGHWRTIGQAAVSNAVAAVPFHVPAELRRQHASLRAIAKGGAYHPASSAIVRVRVG